MGIGAHPPGAGGREGLQLRQQGAVLIEEFPGPVALHPLLQLPQLGGIVDGIRERHLVGPPEALQLLVAEGGWTGPALGRAQNDHRPGGSERLAAAAGLGAERLNGGHRLVHRLRHGVVHRHGVVTLHEVGCPAVARRRLSSSPWGRRARRVGLAILYRSGAAPAARRHRGSDEELVDVPRGGQGAGLRLAVAHAGQGDQVGVVEHGSAGMESTYPSSPPSWIDPGVSGCSGCR